MATRHLSNIEKVSKDLRRRNAIPSKYWTILEERMVITCKPYTRQPRRAQPRTRPEIRLQYTQKKAQQVYLEVLNDAPRAFLPFLLAFPPKACESFDPFEFCENHKNQQCISLNSLTESKIEEIGIKNGISQSPKFKQVKEIYFLKGLHPDTSLFSELTISKF